MSAPDETTIVAMATEGDAGALEEVIKIVQDPVYRLALRMTGRPADAEDATQDVMLQVISKLASWRAESSLVTWAYRIAMNHLLNLRRKPIEVLTFDSLGEELDNGLSATGYQGPEAELLAEEIKLSCTQAMLQCLDRPERAAYVLGAIFGLPSDQAGWILDLTPAAFRKRLERARRRIRTFMSDKCGLVREDAPCRCSKRVETAIAKRRINPEDLVFAAHPTRSAVVAGQEQMSKLHAAAAVMRSHPAYAVPEKRTEAIMAIVRSGRFPLISAPNGPT